MPAPDAPQATTTPVTDPAARPGRGGTLLLAGGLLLVLLGVAGALWLVQRGAGQSDDAARGPTALEDLPITQRSYLQAPDFDLELARGGRITDDDLAGRVYIADFIFTRCPLACPIMSDAMRTVQAGLSDLPTDRIHLLSITVDPEHDTAERLNAYADRFDADPDRWLFAREAEAVTRGLSQDGFKLRVADGEPHARTPIEHSDRLILVDRDGTVRGMYSGTDPEAVERLIADARTLAERPDPEAVPPA